MTWWQADETHDPARTSWVASAQGHADFPIQNLPLGVFSPPGAHDKRIGTAIGDRIMDLAACARAGLLDGTVPATMVAALAGDTLNALFARPAAERRALRHRLSALLSQESWRDAVSPHVHPMVDSLLHLPARIGDYTDFYVGIHHALTVGSLFRPDSPLLPNYRHIPIGYHGRASSVRPSGEPVIRPCGQSKAPDDDAPRFGPATRLDHEVELGVWVGPGNALGQPVPLADAGEHIAGLCLLNDWSARDIQAWEYQPLGPFLGKSFHTTVSPWVITGEALAPFREPSQPRAPDEPAPLPYLLDAGDRAHGGLALQIEAFLSTAAMRQRGLPPHRLSTAPASAMYWTIQQMLAHHTSNGCNLRPGDLLGTGTISGPTSDAQGSMLEITRGGATPITLPDGETRRFLEDGDEITLRATAQTAGRISIGFGECRARIAPAAAPTSG